MRPRNRPTGTGPDRVEAALAAIKPGVRALSGYKAPPQGRVRAKLNQNENPYDLPEAVKEDILGEMKCMEWTRYPTYNPPPLRNALAKRHGLTPDQLIVGGGSNQLLYMMGMAVVSRGDGVVVVPPTFGLFDLIARIFEGRVLAVDQDPGFLINETRLLESASRAKLTFLCSPNNPTGQTVPLELLEAVCGRSRGLVLWDEAYAEFNGVSALPLLEKYPNLVVVRTFSKAFGLAGLRIGYLMGHAALLAELSKVNIPYNVNLFSMLTALRLLEHPQWMETHVREIVAERDRLIQTLASVSRIEPFPSQANFVLIRMPDGKAVFEKLTAKGVLLRAVNGHPLLAHCLRATVGTPQENGIFVDALKETMQELIP